MQIGPMLAALPELLPLPWKYDQAAVSREQAGRLIARFAPGSRMPSAGWEVCLLSEVTRDGWWRCSLHLVNQASPHNLEFIMGLGAARSPLYLELRWRYDWRRAMGA